MSLITNIRKFLWRILGIDYNHILKTIDYVYLKEDPHTRMGYMSYSNNALVFRWSDAPIKIGKYCSIADGVRFIVDDGKHKTKCVSSFPFKDNEVGDRKGITIGNDVWIGQNVTILPGVKIGNGVTVAAGSVVIDDLPSYCVVGGSPAKVIYKKCTDMEAEMMGKIAWWEWPKEKVEANRSFLTGSITDFVTVFSE